MRLIDFAQKRRTLDLGYYNTGWIVQHFISHLDQSAIGTQAAWLIVLLLPEFKGQSESARIIAASHTGIYQISHTYVVFIWEMLYDYSRSSNFFHTTHFIFNQRLPLLLVFAAPSPSTPGSPPVKLKVTHVSFLFASSLTRHHRILSFVRHSRFSDTHFFKSEYR